MKGKAGLNRQQVWRVVGAIFLAGGLPLSGAQAATFIGFDPQGSVNTQPQAINPAGVITGSYQDANSGFGTGYHGFVRSPNGTITVFDPLDSTNTISTNTIVTGINPEGTITGYYADTFGVNHGFLTASNGQITTIDDSGASPPVGANQFFGTFPLGINSAGEITGYYYDTGFVNHGFLRTPGGTFTTFDRLPQGGTTPEAINPAGEIMGFYVDSDPEGVHFFLRATDGTFTSFDPAPF